MEQQIILRKSVAILFAALLISCGKGPSQPETIPPNAEIQNPISTDVVQVFVTCPLNIMRYDDGPDPEYPKIREVYNLEVVGLCPVENNAAKKIEFRTGAVKKLDPQYSKFTVTDSKFTTTNMLDFVSLNQETNNFYITAQNAQKMWASLKKGKYNFSVNLVSEDSEFAENYNFQFEIK